jgi:RNA polymerase sigma-70 factor (sigma-E family)
MHTAQEQDYVDYVAARLPALRRLAYALSGNQHHADDIVQEAITKLYLHWRRASAATNIDGYVRTIVLRTYLDEKRRGWSSRVLLSANPPERHAATGTDPEDRTVLRLALRQVPPRQRAVLVLRFMFDLSVEEVASTMNCSLGTVKSQTSHGVAAMRRLLGAQTIAALKNGS